MKIILLYLITPILGFLKIPFGPKFNINSKEISHEIKYNLPLKKKNIIKNISGFYGLIGPDIQTKKIENIFDLFSKNGIIQGIFFDQGKLHFTKYYIRTDKLLYEEENGLIPINLNNIILFKFFELFNLLPNILGLANTALLNFNSKIYALNERDKPYELIIDLATKQIKTKKKINIPTLNNFLAHAKKSNNTLETLDYSDVIPNVKYFKFDKEFKKINEISINTRYITMIHDFISLNNTILFLDTPMIFDFRKIFNINIPLNFYKNLKSQICLVNKIDNTVKYISVDSMYILHYSHAYENDNEIIVYSCIYDDFDFNKPYNNYGKFRKIVIDKHTYQVKIEKNDELEKYSVEFPVVYKNYTIMIHSNNTISNSFIVVDNFKLYKYIKINKNIYGEPSIIEIKNEPYIVCFTYNNNINYLTLYGLENNEEISIPIPYNISIGFHSILYKK